MSIRYTLVNTEAGAPAATGFPTNAAQTVNEGMNIPGGPLESIIMRFTGTLNAATDIDSDLPSAIASLRLILNGESFFDYRQGYSTPNSGVSQASQFGYFMNSIGENLSSEVVASDTAKEAYLRIPCGIQAPAGISRLEYTMSTSATGGAATNTAVEVWCVYNDSMQTRTTVAAATSFTASGTGQEEVVVRVPSNYPGVLAGVLVQNDRSTDTDITEVRVVSQSDYSLEVNYWRYLNSDLFNTVLFGSAASQTQLNIAQLSPGAVFIPLFGLARGDDIRLQVTTASAQTILFNPVLVAAANASSAAAPSQTQPVATNTLAAVLERSGAANQ